MSKLFRILAPFLLMGALLYFYLRTSGAVITSRAYVRCNELTLRTSASGKLMDVYAEEGELVDSGDLLAIVDTLRMFLKMKSLEKEKEVLSRKLENMQIELRILGRQLDRKRILVETGSSGESEIEDLIDRMKLLKGEMNILKVRMEELDVRIDEVRRDMKDLLVRTPVSGVILDVAADKGVFIPAGSPIIRMCDTGEIYVEAFFRERFLPRIRMGARVRLLGPGKSIGGTIVDVGKEAHYDVYEDETYIIVRIEPDSIPGMWRVKDLRLTVGLER